MDPYLIPGTDTLKNLFGLTDATALAEKERDYSSYRSAQYHARLIHSEPQPFDQALLKQIHGHIFQDVYAWAGKFRIGNISKGNSLFASAAVLEMQTEKLFDSFNTQITSLLESSGGQLTKDRFVRESALFLGELNTLHPFREGNGRTQRMITEIAGNALGFDISWGRVSARQMIDACLHAHHVDESRLVEVLDRSVSATRSNMRIPVVFAARARDNARSDRLRNAGCGRDRER